MLGMKSVDFGVDLWGSLKKQLGTPDLGSSLDPTI